MQPSPRNLKLKQKSKHRKQLHKMLGYTTYSDLPCVCGHMESRHLRLTSACRNKKCGCQEFLNEEYVAWLREVVVSQLKSYRETVLRLAKRKEAA